MKTVLSLGLLFIVLEMVLFDLEVLEKGLPKICRLDPVCVRQDASNIPRDCPRFIPKDCEKSK